MVVTRFFAMFVHLFAFTTYFKYFKNMVEIFFTAKRNRYCGNLSSELCDTLITKPDKEYKFPKTVYNNELLPHLQKTVHCSWIFQTPSLVECKQKYFSSNSKHKEVVRNSSLTTAEKGMEEFMGLKLSNIFHPLWVM